MAKNHSVLKIDREVCLAKYRSLPLAPYDTNSDKEVFFFPECYDSGWYRLPNMNESDIPKALAKDLLILYKACEMQTLLFLQDKKIPWITKQSESRIDYRPVVSAVRYFRSLDLNKSFCGGLQVCETELDTFIRHLYNITRTDSTFHGANFVDDRQLLLGYIHWSGEIKLSALTKTGSALLSKALAKTRFSRTEKE